MSYFRIPMDLRKPKMAHDVYQRLLSGDASKKVVVDRAIADLQWGSEGLPIHPVINGSDA